MKYMSIYPTHLIFIAVMFLPLAGTRVNFKPFKISFENPYQATGWVLIIIGALLLQYQTRQNIINKYGKELEDLQNRAIETVKKSQKQLDELKDKNAEQKWHNVDTKE